MGNGQGRRLADSRPRKTQEELDQEMEDYWGNAHAEADKVAPEAPQQTIVSLSTAVAGDDDIDMIE
jgi:THO complex subunit 4